MDRRFFVEQGLAHCTGLFLANDPDVSAIAECCTLRNGAHDDEHTAREGHH